MAELSLMVILFSFILTTPMCTEHVRYFPEFVETKIKGNIIFMVLQAKGLQSVKHKNYRNYIGVGIMLQGFITKIQRAGEYNFFFINMTFEYQSGR